MVSHSSIDFDINGAYKIIFFSPGRNVNSEYTSTVLSLQGRKKYTEKQNYIFLEQIYNLRRKIVYRFDFAKLRNQDKHKKKM